MVPSRAAKLSAAACAFLFLVCMLIAHPWANMPILDDWSYVYTAEGLARTGHIRYNGWATAIVGSQFYLGAGMMKLFGFSMTAARMSTLIVATATVFVCQLTFIEFGCSIAAATLGTMGVCFSPIFMQLSAIFMTDVQGMFATILCVYCCARAMNDQRGRAVLWICAAAATNVVIGSCRQVALLGVLIVVPATIVYLRNKPGVLRISGPVWIASVGCVLWMVHWFSKQPYALSEAFRFHFHRMMFAHMALQLSDVVLECLLLNLGLLVIFVAFVPRKVLWPALVFITVLLWVVISHHWSTRDYLLAPFLQNFYSIYGHFNIEFPIMQAPPVVLGNWSLAVLNFLLWAGIAGLISYFWLRSRGKAESTREEHGGLSWKQTAYLTVPYFVVYMVLLVPRSAESLADRYCMPVAFVAALWLARACRDIPAKSWFAAGGAVTVVVALFSIGSVHDLFAYYRAKGAAVAELTQANVPASAIDAGWDFDGWVELQQAPYVNSNRIATPAGAYHPNTSIDPESCFFPAFADLFPHAHPLFGIRFDAQSCYGPAPFAGVSYVRWLGLGNRTNFYVVRYLPKSRSVPTP